MQAIKKRMRDFPAAQVRRGVWTGVLLCGALVLWGCTPPGPRALLQGDKWLQKGQHARAIEELQTAVRIIPEEPRAWNHLGLALQAGGQVRPAMDAYRQALARDRGNQVLSRPLQSGLPAPGAKPVSGGH